MDSVPFTIGGIPYSESTYGIKVDDQGEYRAWFRNAESPLLPSRLAAVKWLIGEIWKTIEKEYFDEKHTEDRKSEPACSHS